MFSTSVSEGITDIVSARVSRGCMGGLSTCTDKLLFSTKTVLGVLPLLAYEGVASTRIAMGCGAKRILRSQPRNKTYQSQQVLW